MIQPMQTNAFLQPTKTATHHVHSMPGLCLPTSPYPTVFASAKPIVKMDCTLTWPKTNDAIISR